MSILRSALIALAAMATGDTRHGAPPPQAMAQTLLPQNTGWWGGPRAPGTIPGGLFHATRSGKKRWKRARRVRG